MCIVYIYHFSMHTWKIKKQETNSSRMSIDSSGHGAASYQKALKKKDFKIKLSLDFHKIKIWNQVLLHVYCARTFQQIK